MSKILISKIPNKMLKRLLSKRGLKKGAWLESEVVGVFVLSLQLFMLILG